MIFFEKLEDVPEQYRADYVESEFEGKKGFQHKQVVAMANTMRNAKQEKQQFQSQLTEISEKLNGYEATKKAEIEAARQKALEEARNAGDVKALEERYQQQMEDLRQRVADETRSATLAEVAKERAAEKASSIRSKIGAELGIDQDAAESIDILLNGRVQWDSATGKEIYFDAKGSALSVDRVGFIGELKKEGRFKHLIKADIVTNGGGMLNGGGRGSALSKGLNEMTATEEAVFAKQYPDRYQELLRQHKG